MTQEDLLTLLQKRFERNTHRHPTILYTKIEQYLLEHPSYFTSLIAMEQSGGEIDVFVYKEDIYVVDFSKETPIGRRNVCYDYEARIHRKKFPPETSALEMAATMNINLMDIEMYQAIQTIENLDTKTSSWILTPAPIRTLGGALFGDKRYDHTFIYHNGADSYYGVRGFRGYVKLAIQN